MPRQVSIAQASNSLSALVHDVETGPAVELTRRGKPVAILLSKASYERYERLKPPSTDFWEAIQRFRSEVDLDEINIDEALEGVRNRSPGERLAADHPKREGLCDLASVQAEDWSEP